MTKLNFLGLIQISAVSFLLNHDHLFQTLANCVLFPIYNQLKNISNKDLTRWTKLNGVSNLFLAYYVICGTVTNLQFPVFISQYFLESCCILHISVCFPTAIISFHPFLLWLPSIYPSPSTPLHMLLHPLSSLFVLSTRAESQQCGNSPLDWVSYQWKHKSFN